MPEGIYINKNNEILNFTCEFLYILILILIATHYYYNIKRAQKYNRFYTLLWYTYIFL